MRSTGTLDTVSTLPSFQYFLTFLHQLQNRSSHPPSAETPLEIQIKLPLLV